MLDDGVSVTDNDPGNDDGGFRFSGEVWHGILGGSSEVNTGGIVTGIQRAEGSETSAANLPSSSTSSTVDGGQHRYRFEGVPGEESNLLGQVGLGPLSLGAASLGLFHVSPLLLQEDVSGLDGSLSELLLSQT